MLMESNELETTWRLRRKEEEVQLVEVLLRGKAPWGFTLRGGSEHRETLLITKVEGGSVAAAVRLQVGDEVVGVNGFILDGSRQEAISLVKKSHKSLRLLLRYKMVDVVSPHSMPSETEVHVARSFLTKILRSSMRKNDSSSRPHSWHSSKLTEEESEPPRATEATPAPVWKAKHESRPKESSCQGVHNSQLDSVNNMERLERHSHPYPQGRLSPTKFTSSPEPLCGPGGKRDSGFSCFSSGSSPPVHDHSMTGRKGTSTENIFFKGLQNEGQFQAERPRYLQPTLGNGGWEGSWMEEQLRSRVSGGVRSSVGPVWQVPEKKSQSPPPPPPPLRSDSFAATKVFPSSEGPGGPTKNHGRSLEKLTENNDQNDLRLHQEKTSEARRSFNLLPTKDLLHPNMAADNNCNRTHPNKLFSLSSNDVRQSHYTHVSAHQRQYSDESPLNLQIRSAPTTKTQSVGSYYRSLQDLPTNVFSRKHIQQSAVSSVSNPENGGYNRYYSLMNKQSVQTTEHQSRQSKAEGRRGEAERPHWVNSNEQAFPSTLKTNVKAKYTLPQSQMPYSDNKEGNGHSHLGSDLQYDNQTSELAVLNNDHMVSRSRHQDPWVPQEDHRISPLKTPLLHSLAQESRSLAERQPAVMSSGVMSNQDVGDTVATSGGKASRRSDRYATTLRKEIQQKRAQLQKSRSAVTLSCEADDEEAEEWRSTETSASSGISFSNTYKDYLKEAQARVLQATSFQRRDLEPFGPDAPGAKTSNGRIRGRKRFPLAKRTHSFSEPDKIDKVGVEVELQTGSFGERRKFFEAKPAFCRPVPRFNQGFNLNPDRVETGKSKERTPFGEPEETNPSVDPNCLSPGRKQVLLEQQRLETFADYQATWNKQKKSSEGKSQGRYHSAENILDADAEEKAVCVHERSRSSPSADFCTQNIPSTWRDPQARQSSYTTRVKTETRTQPDHSPQPVPSVLVPSGLVQGLPDHRTRPDSGGLPSLTTLPSPGSQPPRPHLAPETTSSSLEFPAGAQADRSSPGPDAPAGSAGLGRTSRGGGGGGGEEEQQSAAASSPSSPSDTLFPPGRDQDQTQDQDWDWNRSPSPQFAPLRLTDKPPAVTTQDDSFRSGTAVLDPSSPVRKVPVRIVHAETSWEREGRSYLIQGGGEAALAPPPYVASPGSSPFSAYTRRDPGPEPGPTRRSEEDQKRDELVRDIAGKDRSPVDFLDQNGRRTTMDLMEGLVPQEDQVPEGAQNRRRVSTGSRMLTSSPRTLDRREEEVPSSSYYNTSAPKAELLIKMKDMQEQLEEQEEEDELDVDLAAKKQELIVSLARKLEVLKEARQSLQEDVEDNESLGRQVDAAVQRLCRPNQLDKFRMFVGDLDKVVSLLLSLSGRLARVDHALYSLEDQAPPEERRTLMEKRTLLIRQHEDARELKENLDRRQRLVSAIMEDHLDPEGLDDYRHFVKMKAALIMEQRKLEDRIKLGEEQLHGLMDSLDHRPLLLDQRPPPLDQRPLLLDYRMPLDPKPTLDQRPPPPPLDYRTPLDQKPTLDQRPPSLDHRPLPLDQRPPTLDT